MLADTPLLTVLFVVCYFIGKGPRNVFSTTLTRGAVDTFTACCETCHKFGAMCLASGVNVCQCGQSTKDFFRFKKSCQSGEKLRQNERCFRWSTPNIIEVVDTEGSLSYYRYWKEVRYNSCSVESVFYLDDKGFWQLLFLPAEVLETVEKAPGIPALKVTGNSPDLVKYKGYVMKVTLRCQRRDSGDEERCLVFKTKGNFKFQLLNSTVTPLSCTATNSSNSSNIQPTSTLSIPVITSDKKDASVTTLSITPAATVGESQSLQSEPASFPSETPGSADGQTERNTDDIFVTLIATIGAILCVIVICGVVWAVYRYKYRSRTLDARNFDNLARVINNAHPQNFTVKEEPIYVELPEILPSGQSKMDNRASNGGLEMFAVVCNPTVKEASLPPIRKFTDPLPSRPMHGQSAKPDKGVGVNDQNDAVKNVTEDLHDSVVLRNPHATRLDLTPTRRSLSRGEDTSITCVGHQHHANDEVHDQTIERERNDPIIYQGLDKGRRTQSIFVCGSCSDGAVYQRLSGERSCLHQPNDTNEGKRQSVYASLSLERSSRDSVYVPLGTGVAVEENQERQAEGNDTCEDTTPVYHVLEPGVSGSTSEPVGPEPDLDFDQASINHDYNVLEEEEEKETTINEPDCDSKYETMCRQVPAFQPLEYLYLERAPSPMVPRKTILIERLTLRPRSSSA